MTRITIVSILATTTILTLLVSVMANVSGLPYCNYSMMGPKTLLKLLRPLYYMDPSGFI